METLKQERCLGLPWRGGEARGPVVRLRVSSGGTHAAGWMGVLLPCLCSSGGRNAAGGVFAGVVPWKGCVEFRVVGLRMGAACGGTLVTGEGLFSIIIEGLFSVVIVVFGGAAIRLRLLLDGSGESVLCLVVLPWRGWEVGGEAGGGG